jgi:hemolysin activation/secretion protein
VRFNASMGDFASSSSEIGSNLRFTGDNTSFGVELMRRFSVFQDWSLRVGAGASYTSYTVETGLPSVTLSEGSSDFLVPFVQASLTRDEGWWNAGGSLRVEHSVSGIPNEDPLRGINALGRIEADPSWTALRWSLHGGIYLDRFLSAGERPLAHELSGRLRGRFLLDGERLVAQEQDLIGGAFTVRGYPESALGADESLVASIEYAFHIPRTLAPGERGTLFGQPFRWRPPSTQRLPDWDLVLRAFADYGHRWVGEPPSAGGAIPSEDRSLADTDLGIFGSGVGVELVILQNLSIRCDVGIAMKEVAEDVPAAPPGVTGETFVAPPTPPIAQSGDVRAHVVVSFSW